MYNYVMLIGRVTKDAEYKIVKDKKLCNLSLAVRRPFQNPNGEYDTDFFNINLWEVAAEIAGDNLTKGQLVVIKGRLVPRKKKAEDGKEYYSSYDFDIVGEQVIFANKAPFASLPEDLNEE